MIPRLSSLDQVPLIRTRDADGAALASAGARCGRDRWWIARTPDVDLPALSPFLPRFAQAVLVPEVVDLIPSTSWCASLANMLLPSSWSRLRAIAVDHFGGCQNCGMWRGLECHESWSYDRSSGIQRLEGLRALCGPCHETCHLGLARVRGRFDQVFGRLVSINRVADDERREYLRQIDGKFHLRSTRDWTLDLSGFAHMRLALRRSFRRVGLDAVEGGPAERRFGTRITGVDIVGRDGALVLA